MKKVSRVLRGDSVKFSPYPMFFFFFLSYILAHRPPNRMFLVLRKFKTHDYIFLEDNKIKFLF